MKEYKREHPLFALCGLNCGLCPRHHTNGKSKCPGCGGEDFHLKHPSCTVITCGKKHGNVEFCFQCASYPCARYDGIGESKDSFITYKNVLADFDRAKNGGIAAYMDELNKKIEILEFLIEHYNDGRRKNFYCLAVNLLKLEDICGIMEHIDKDISCQNLPLKDKIIKIVSLFEDKASENDISLVVRK